MPDEKPKTKDELPEAEALESKSAKKTVKKDKAVSKKKAKSAFKAPESKPSPKPDLIFTPVKSYSAPRSISYKPESRKTGGPKFALVVIGVLILMIIAGAWYQTQKLTKESRDISTGIKAEVTGEVDQIKEKLQSITAELEQQKEKLREGELVYSAYVNHDIGITFQYPKQLGEANAEIIETDEADDANVINITFSNNPDVWVTAAMKGYEDKEDIVYNGTYTNLVKECDEPLEIDANGYCDLTTINGQRTIEFVRVIGDGALQNTVKSVWLNLDQQSKYDGLAINVGLGLPPVTGRSLFKPVEDDRDAEETFYRNLVKGEGLSLIVKDNLAAYNAIKGSLQFLPNAS